SGGRVLRISMDGNDVEEISGMASTHHDLAPTPDGGFAAIQKEASGQGCDEIIKYTPGSGVTTIYTVRDAFANVPTQGGETCHCNSIMYHAADDSYTVSDLSHVAYFKFGSDGTLHWVIGGGGPTDFHFSGPGTSWDRQH